MNSHAPPHDGWIAHHPGTGRASEHETLAGAVLWFAGETLEWLSLRWFIPVLVAGVVIGSGWWRGKRGVRS